MERETLLDEVRRFDPEVPIEEAWTPPSSWYTRTGFYEIERDVVFGRTWQPVARVDQIANPGDYITGCLAGEPWVVLRDHDGEVRAYHNTCRHKGREVVQGEGNAGELVCGYHAWRYQLDGRLKSAPQMAGIKNFDRREMSLVSMRAEIWGPWVFINGNPAAPSLIGRLGELDERLEKSGWRDLRFFDRKTWTIECNWKVYADNYLDGGYHIPHMHPSLDAQLDMKGYRTELFGEFSIQSAPAAGVADDRTRVDAKERIGAGAIYAWIYPNFTLNRYGPCVDSNYIIPLGPNRCTVVYDFFFQDVEGEDTRKFVEESIAQSDVTQREDIAICESVQVGLGSRSYDRGRYAPNLETGEHHFHRLLYHDLFSGLDGGK